MSTFRFHDIYSSTVKAHDKTDKDNSEDLYKHINPRTLDVYADLVLVFKYKQPTVKGIAVSKPEYEQKTLAAYQDVLTRLTRVGLQYETRPSGSDTLLIFILCPWAVLKREANRARYAGKRMFFHTLETFSFSIPRIAISTRGV